MGVAAAVVLAGCTSNERQDAKEKKATYKVAVVESSFPAPSASPRPRR